MSNNDLENSFKQLKKTIPLLLKHKIPAVPINYALWYTYVSNESASLNEILDQAIQHNLPLSKSKTKALYRKHAADDQEVDVWELRQSIESMIVELSQSVKDTRNETRSFKSTMDTCMDDLAKVEREGLSMEEVMSLVRSLVTQTKQIRGSTLSFSTALMDAEREISRLKDQLEQSQQAALYDALTGLCNRRYFDEELATQAMRPNMCLILADLDNFKIINDTHGHVMGDLILKASAKKLQASCRNGAQAFRFGGEEFAIIVPNCKLDMARQIAETMRRSIEKIGVRDKRTSQVLGGISASFGVAEIQKGMNPLALIEAADQLLYKAKSLGRNRVMPMSNR
ncbi:GGDEF domain-containing protein [Paraglaciecola polaris]|uniref:diguanylate cyclase n=1 Tax=Paraglaciecola polaris LMG 21857 TaxID=1129793 RepID=K7AAR1_9ALTE|nr:GGDEF domain-containing protein [Paraglaciecola polaris]GAC32475.1 diguanylate cyclase [Paraglaciecola polaris LMG 21857]